MIPDPIDKGSERNSMCGCGSGLKIKHCHGDQALKRDASNIANGMLMLFIAQRRIDKKLATADDTIKLINKMTGDINDLLPECVLLSTNYEVKKEESEVDKLADKEASGASITDLQKDMVKCSGCGRRLPAGMECAKCKGSVYE